MKKYILQFFILFTFPSFHLLYLAESNIKVKRFTYIFSEDFNILYSKLNRTSLVILGVKNENFPSKKLTVGLYKLKLKKTGLIVSYRSIKSFRKIKDLYFFLKKKKIKSTNFGKGIIGGLISSVQHSHIPKKSYTILIKTLYFNSSKYTLRQERAGNINDISSLKTSIRIYKGKSLEFDKSYDLLTPFSISKIKDKFSLYSCAFKFSLIKNVIEYIFNKGISLNCFEIDIDNMKENKLLTTYFDPDEFAYVMRGSPVVYVLPIKSEKFSKIVFVLRKKKIIFYFCDLQEEKCHYKKEGSIPIEFPKIVEPQTQLTISKPRIYLIYPHSVELIVLDSEK
jgi:hypothetical protein